MSWKFLFKLENFLATLFTACLTPQCHWPRGVWLCGVNDNAEFDSFVSTILLSFCTINRGPEWLQSWKKGVKISWHCPFNISLHVPVLRMSHITLCAKNNFAMWPNKLATIYNRRLVTVAKTKNPAKDILKGQSREIFNYP